MVKKANKKITKQQVDVVEENKKIVESVDTPQGVSLVKEISKKILASKTMNDLEALNQEVFNAFGENIPASIQSLAEKKADQITIPSKVKYETEYE